jgi:hypothetical protein
MVYASTKILDIASSDYEEGHSYWNNTSSWHLDFACCRSQLQKNEFLEFRVTAGVYKDVSA